LLIIKRLGDFGDCGLPFCGWGCHIYGMVGFGGFDVEGLMGLLFAFARVMEMHLERFL
jgi:hypothetical protein